MSVSPTYDARGNLTFDGTFTYGYDAESRLVSTTGAGNSASYTYDAKGRRKSKTVNGTTTNFVCAGGREIMEYDGSSGQLLQRYVYGKGGQGLSLVDGAGNRSTPVPDIHRPQQQHQRASPRRRPINPRRRRTNPRLLPRAKGIPPLTIRRRAHQQGNAATLLLFNRGQTNLPR